MRQPSVEFGRHDSLTGHSLRCGRAEPADGGGHHGGREQAPAHLRGGVFGDHPGRGGATRQQHVDADAGAGKICRHDLGEGLRTGPRGAVGDKAWPAHGGVIHRYVDDAAPARPQQMRNDLAGDQEVAGQVGGDHLQESLGGDLPKWQRAGEELGIDRAHPEAGIVDQHVEATEPLHDLGDPQPHLMIVAHVHRETDRLARSLRHFLS